jgi:hypothetical protein
MQAEMLHYAKFVGALDQQSYRSTMKLSSFRR